MTEQPRLHHLLDRMRRGALLPAEAEALAARVTELEAEVARLTTGQPTPGPVTAHPYQGDGHLHPCTHPGHGICGRSEYDHEAG